MSDDALRDALAAGIASLSREQAAPTGALGWGRDLSCASDLDPYMSEIDPTSTTALAQAIVRRLDCPRGSLPPDGRDASSYGIALRDALNRGTTADDLRALGAAIRAELEKDDRIQAVTEVRVEASSLGGARTRLDVTLKIRPYESAGTFALVLAVTDAAVVIDAIGGAA